jgi:uncharacterized protein YndB with AHSA1/START domain
MKNLLIIFVIMATTTYSTAQDGKAVTVKKTFSRQTSVSNIIKANPATIWALLTNASDMARWNSTLISVEGDIKVGEKIKLKSKLDPNRTFKLKVKELIPEKRLVWGDGQGSRVYTLTNNGNGTVTFLMDEKIGGLMFPLYAKMIPPFDASFEQMAADLKREAELK